MIRFLYLEHHALKVVGALQELVGKHSFTYLELCRLMMVLSDNIATNLLITVLGMENINARAEQLGVDEIELKSYDDGL